MRLLWISTKPPLPAIDGGRLLQHLTLRVLAERDVEVTLVCPVEPGTEAPSELTELCRPVLVESSPPSRVAILSSKEPAAIARHRRPEVEEAVVGLLADGSFDAVHVEQIHALPQAEPAQEHGLRVVLRAQNVESDLWRTMSTVGGAKGLLARREAPRMAAWEGQAVVRADAVVALSEPDAEALRRLAADPGTDGDPGGDAAPVVHLPAPFPAESPAGEEPLPGAPAVVLLGSGGWFPNQDAVRWFCGEIWPVVREARPGAVLHRFDGETGEEGDGEAAVGAAEDGAAPSEDGVVVHPRPGASRDAFAPGAVLAVPLRIASGVRMKILESFSRGLPVVASSAAAVGLDVEDGRELLLADAPPSFAAALSRLATEEELAPALITAGRELLRRHHDPGAIADRLIRIYAGDEAD